MLELRRSAALRHGSLSEHSRRRACDFPATRPTPQSARPPGLTDREILDIVGLVALNVLTGTFNLVAGLRPDVETRQVA